VSDLFEQFKKWEEERAARERRGTAIDVLQNAAEDAEMEEAAAEADREMWEFDDRVSGYYILLAPVIAETIHEADGDKPNLAALADALQRLSEAVRPKA
jgi:hypothetical protein